MPVFRVQIFYQLGATGKWSNVYHVRGADLVTVQGSVNANMVPTLLTILDPTAQITRVLVSDESSSAFVENAVGSNGSFADSGSLLPLYNSLKALFATDGLGRPDLKYYKGVVGENLQSAGVLSPTTVTGFDTILTGMLNDMAGDATPLVSESDDEWTAVSIQADVQMRQMHRRRRRAVSP